MQKNMKNENKITLSEWSKLTSEEKEKLRNWAIKQGCELDIVPGTSGSFDPVCDYAALLNTHQMVTFLKGDNQKISTTGNNQYNPQQLWKQVLKILRSTKLST